MEIRVLRYFLTVAREGSVTGAANFLHVTQPTLSRQIRDLEEELGVRLLTRHSHSVALTPEGMRFRKRAEEILDMVEKTETEFSGAEEAVSGDVHIGGGETKGMRLITEVMQNIRNDHPGIRFHLFSGNAADVAERLGKGLLDFGILIQPADITGCSSMSLPAKDAWGVLMRTDSPLAGKKSLTRKDLLTVPLICSRRMLQRGPLRISVGQWFGKDLRKLNTPATYNLIYNAALMVEEGMGYALTIDGLTGTAGSGLCFRPLQPKMETGLSMVWKKYQLFSPAANIFLQRMTEKFGHSGNG